ncbi:WXG100 family type VII secretion target [Nocardioides marmotae]|uniref:WXG100 family type VII secretion target n=1 Tax=Nocardioides marmotae TaxID=2663857 RepID=A0A6I3JD02_9ACTN|nr:hypothetical protein [Nocardioides marmotae]MCR6032313.1 hypothetical protein [Gordonia jinghuaiqii]MBC9734888.1 hypothetical protein [Nocardioides marmotae]MTB85989.1 hypothetical protein [Nocardioides marmotae]MTB95961.1 hypothetical protein [Nocardioides marmotae]QKE02707.1 hypothetical protein HPC71_17725 [Nocardioides marmotae]
MLVGLHLVDPEPGEAELRHDATFELWDESISALRDVVNTGIRTLNQVGAGLPLLPEGSLEELLVQPLTGDYGAIRQNATACHQVADALGTWTANLVRVATTLDPRWDGLAGTAFTARLSVQAVAARGLAEVVRRGSALLEEIAEVSERLGVRVEELLVELGKAIARLARRLLARVGGPAGWASFAAELALRGLDAVTDIVDDVRRVVDLVEAVLDLHRTVADWAEVQRDRLAVFEELAA